MNNEWEELEQLMREDPSAMAAAMGTDASVLAGLARLREMAPFTDNRYSDSDIGNGTLFADYWGDICRYVPQRKSWFVYRGGAWQKDEGGLESMRLCKQLVRMLGCLAAEQPGALRDAAIKRASRLTRRTAREVMLRDAQDGACLPYAEFDRHPWLFNCLNGTLDLRNFTLRPHDPADLLTAMAQVRYDPSARCQRWEQFVQQVMAVSGESQLTLEGDETQQKARYLQKIFGYALCGENAMECLFLLYGPSTRNGKGTLVETVLRMMGSYGRTLRPETLSALGASGSAPNEDVARLRGSRFASVPEPDYAQILNAAFIKRATGNDTLSARFLHENSFEFRPEFKLFINTNHLLRVKDPTLFRSGRVRMVRFDRHFLPHERDSGLKTLFARPEALSAVLNWCLEGMRMYLEEGLEEPACMREAVEEYRLDTDLIQQFMDECLVRQPGARTRTSSLFAAYRLWSRMNGYEPENARQFRRLIGEKATVLRGRVDPGAGPSTCVLDWRLREQAQKMQQAQQM